MTEAERGTVEIGVQGRAQQRDISNEGLRPTPRTYAVGAAVKLTRNTWYGLGWDAIGTATAGTPKEAIAHFVTNVWKRQPILFWSPGFECDRLDS